MKPYQVRRCRNMDKATVSKTILLGFLKLLQALLDANMMHEALETINEMIDSLTKVSGK